MKPTAPDLRAARDAFERRAWRRAHEAFSARSDALGAADLWRFALSAYLIGEEDDFVRAAQAAHHAWTREGEGARAARTAFWLGFHLANRGEVAGASGWFGRAARLLEDADREAAESGYLLLPTGQRQLASGDYAAAADTAVRAIEIGRSSGDADLLALALHLKGRALLRQRKLEPGLALLDEAMVAVSTDELSPQVTGLIYCSVIGACREVWEVRRAHAWTAALAAWCAEQPDLVPYAGECRVYRAEILLLRGAWEEAFREARAAADHLAGGAQPATEGLAHYVMAEVHRLRGKLDRAEEEYRAASRAGREPQPGLALLRLAQQEGDAAISAVRRALSETTDPVRRSRLLPAHVEIALACGAADEARGSADELERLAEDGAGAVLGAVAAASRGAVALATGDARAALPLLRRAWREWQALDAPYEAARTRTLLARACLELGDADGSALELDAARAAFLHLGAEPDLARVDAVDGGEPPKGRSGPAHGLTRRECQVLALVATGRTNRQVGHALSISEKTVARHVANIFGKLGLSSRAAATAWAYEHDLAGPSA